MRSEPVEGYRAEKTLTSTGSASTFHLFCVSSIEFWLTIGKTLLSPRIGIIMIAIALPETKLIGGAEF